MQDTYHQAPAPPGSRRSYTQVQHKKMGLTHQQEMARDEDEVEEKGLDATARGTGEQELESREYTEH